MALAAARIWKWWKPIFIRRKWLKSMAALKASKEAKERQAKEAKRKEATTSDFKMNPRVEFGLV